MYKDTAKQLSDISEDLDDPQLFPDQDSFQCPNCSGKFSFGFVLRRIIDSLLQINPNQKRGIK